MGTCMQERDHQSIFFLHLPSQEQVKCRRRSQKDNAYLSEAEKTATKQLIMHSAPCNAVPQHARTLQRFPGRNSLVPAGSFFIPDSGALRITSTTDIKSMVCGTRSLNFRVLGPAGLCKPYESYSPRNSPLVVGFWLRGAGTRMARSACWRPIRARARGRKGEYVNIYRYIYIHMYISCIFAHLSLHVYVYMYVYTICMYTYIYIHMYVRAGGQRRDTKRKRERPMFLPISF